MLIEEKLKSPREMFSVEFKKTTGHRIIKRFDATMMMTTKVDIAKNRR